jgi:hypothetical protein
MEIPRLAHLAIAAVFLLQSTVAAATVMHVGSSSGSSLLSSTESENVGSEGKAPCHENAMEAVTERVNGCCASMDELCCKLGCTAPGVALPVNTVSLSRKHQTPPIPSGNSLRLDNLPDGFFRPPRSI